MLKTLFKRRKVAVAAITFVGASAMTAMMAMPAGATGPGLPDAGQSNTVLVEGGSNTAYTVMQQLSNLYNSVPGCNLTAASGTQQLNYTCPSNPQPFGENGYDIVGSSTCGCSQNPYNDVVYEEPALGSSNGIKELWEFTSPPAGVGITELNLARSSRAPTASDPAGLNFVGYAEDAVPWFHFSKFADSAIGCTTSTAFCQPAAASINNLTNAQLLAIYNGTDTTWNQVDSSLPDEKIDVYMAQSGSGTESTWATDIGLTGTFPYGGEDTDHVIFENEDSSILNNAEEGSSVCNSSTNQATQACPWNAIFFFSYGKFSILCPSGVCGSTPAANKGTVAELGEINGNTADQDTITQTCTGTAKQIKKCTKDDLDAKFFTDRMLYNVTTDGSNGAIPLPTQAADNFASSWGFLCSQQAHNTVDPLSPTGATYGSEIDSIISAQGFFPIPLGAQGDTAANVVPPDFTDQYYAAASPNPSAVSDNGYCKIVSTNP